MKYNIVLTEQAEDDLTDIYAYILNVLKSKINADSILDRIHSALKELSFMAESYHLYPNEPWHSLGIHYFSVGNYSIFYTIDKSDGTAPLATIIHISYGRRDIDEVLRN